MLEHAKLLMSTESLDVVTTKVLKKPVSTCTYLHMYNTGTPKNIFTWPALPKKTNFESGLIRKKQSWLVQLRIVQFQVGATIFSQYVRGCP